VADSSLAQCLNPSVPCDVGFPGDFDLDGDVDQEDFGQFQACYTGDGVQYETGCQKADFDNDFDVDVSDFNIFLDCMGGANQSPGCL